MEKIQDFANQIINNVEKVIIGQRAVLEELLVAIAAGGHVLMIGLPGLAKTRSIKTMAKNVESEFSRIQFTPDLMPADITGTDILQETDKPGRRAFESASFRPARPAGSFVRSRPHGRTTECGLG